MRRVCLAIRKAGSPGATYKTMEQITALISSLKNIRDNYLTLASEVLDENASKIEDLNLQQLYDGERPDGSQITPFYTANTVAIKKSKGQPYDRVTERDTGAFWNSIKAKSFGNQLQMEATDPKTEKLKAKYGNTIGLSDDSMTIVVQEILKPGLGNKFQQQLPQ